jgi:hypothetical protein
VELYAAKFMELARFAINMVPDDESMAERFQEGLLPRIRDRVACLEIKDFNKLVNVTSIAERGHNDKEAIRENKNDSFLRCLVLQRNLLLAVAQDSSQEGMFQFSKEVRRHV